MQGCNPRVFWASSWDYGTFYMQPAKAQASLRIWAVSPEPLLFPQLKYGSRQRVQPKIRHIAPLDGCACTFEESVNGGQQCRNLITWSFHRALLLSTYQPHHWATLSGLTLMPNFYYHDSITMGETITILLLSRTWYHDASWYCHQLQILQTFHEWKWL